MGKDGRAISCMIVRGSNASGVRSSKGQFEMNSPTQFYRSLQQLLACDILVRHMFGHHIGKELKQLARRDHTVDPGLKDLARLLTLAKQTSGVVRTSVERLAELSSHQSMAEYSNKVILRQIADHEEQIRILRAKLK